MRKRAVSTHLTETISISQTTSYDENAKELLSDKNLLAHILAGVVAEFEGWEIQDVIPCIEGEPQISRVPIDVVPCISGSNTEDIVVSEGRVTYDIRFNVVIPAWDDKDVIGIKLLIDMEMQAKGTGLGYNILNRATYSVARMISSQKNKEFVNDNYDGIKKVYSIWICASPEYRYRNTILKYSMKEDVLYGNVKSCAIRSLQNIIIINLDGKKNLPSNEEEKPTLVGLLNTIFTSPLSSEEKIKRLENVYNIPSTEKIKGGVAKMCNLSSEILEEGRAEGRAEGELIGLIKAMHIYSKMSVEEISVELNHPIEYVMEVVANLQSEEN